jgi:acetyl esterase/lipase
MRLMILSVSVFFLIAAVPSWGSDEPFTVPLWSDVVPGPSSNKEELIRDLPVSDNSKATRNRHIVGVTKPTMSVYLPGEPRSDCPAVLILPGGGFNILVMDREGHEVARWLNKHGIAGIVVKYRLPDLAAKMYVHNTSLPDVLRAMRVARSNAESWRIDPNRIGVTGFSAGGYLTAAIGTLFDGGNPNSDDPTERESSRPDFIAPIYPLVSLGPLADSREMLLDRMLGPNPSPELRSQYSPEERVTENTPPTFLVHASDDQLNAEHSIAFYLALKRAHVPVEMHVYSQGGHGFGIRQRGLPVSSWADRWLEWMRAQEFIGTN